VAALPVGGEPARRRGARARSKTREVVDEPHGLRATAATFHASRGLDAFALQAFMGWETVDRAREYIRLSGETTARALSMVHSR